MKAILGVDIRAHIELQVFRPNCLSPFCRALLSSGNMRDFQDTLAQKGTKFRKYAVYKLPNPSASKPEILMSKTKNLQPRPKA